MRLCALGLCGAFAVVLLDSPAQAADQTVSANTPIAVNDHDGGFIPKAGTDRHFSINPDGAMAPIGASDNADQDKDGSDIAIYQGEDDQVPA